MDYSNPNIRIIAKIIPQGSKVLVNKPGRNVNEIANGEKDIIIKSFRDGQIFCTRLVTRNYLRKKYLLADGEIIGIIPETAFDIKYASPYLNAEP